MKKGFRVAFLLLVICGAIPAFSYGVGYRPSWKADYAIQDIIPTLNKHNLSEDDYKLLLAQTGLGKPAVDLIINESKGRQNILKFQRQFFNPPHISVDMIGPVTIENVYSDENNNPINGFDIVAVKEGDVLISSSTSTLGINHGHSAIVVDSANGLALEAFTVGQDSGLQDINLWRRYSNFVLLRPKNLIGETTGEIAKFARENLVNQKYYLTAGLVTKLVPLEKMKGTHCSHIVWYPYMQFGYDIDSNKGRIVTPKDIINSPLLEVVQVYGMNPITLWN